MLLEAPLDPSRRQKNSVLLAIDLTTAVADEAIQRKDSAVVAYRMSHYPTCSKQCKWRVLPYGDTSWAVDSSLSRHKK